MADGTADVGKSAAAEARKLKVFISYSRDDLDFADQLVAALELCGFEPTIDRHGISGGEAWQQRLGALILEADTVVFVLSPASARSSICTWEVTEAARLSKRILPVLARALDGASPPQLLQDLNYVHFYPEPRAPGSGFGVGLAALAASLNTDLDWIREHTRLLERATEWASRGRPVSRLLSGSDIADAKKWVNERPKGAPEPTARHLEFIRASEDQETLRANSERQRLEEMAAAQEERAKALRAAEEALRKEAEAQRARARARSIITWGSAGAVLVLVVAFAFAMRQTFEADRQRAEAQAYLRDAQITQSRALADAAQREATEGDYATGILLSLEALPDATQKFERTLVTEARRSLLLGLHFLRERFVFDGDASLSPDGRLVLTRPAGKAPRLWDATAGRELFVLGPPGQTADVAAFSPDGKQVLTSPKDTAPRLWDAATGKELVTFGGTAEAASSAWFSPDGNLVITTFDGKPPRLWQSATGKELFVLGDQNEDVRSISFSPDSKFVLTWPQDRSPRLWNTATGSEAFALGGGELAITGASFSPDGKFVFTESRRKGLRLWDVATGNNFALGDPEGSGQGLFSPNGRFVLVYGRDKAPRLWDTASIQEPLVLGDAAALRAHFSPDSDLVLTVSGAEAPQLWETSTGNLLFALGDHNTAGARAVFSPDSKLLLTASAGSDVRLWDTATGTVRFVLSEGVEKKIARAFFSPNGKHILTTPATGGSLRLWSIATRAEQFVFSANAHTPDTVFFSPDGTVALTKSRLGGRVAHMWDLTIREHDPRPGQRDTGQSTIERAKLVVPRCLTIEQRKAFLLRPQPPRWCIEMGKYPYDTDAWKTEGTVDTSIAEEFGNFADAAVKAGDFPKGLEAADLGLKFGPDLLWIRVNRAHALMFLERLEEARAEYLAHRGKDVPDHGLWESVVLRDIEELRANDRDHRLMAEIENLFRKPSASQ